MKTKKYIVNWQNRVKRIQKTESVLKFVINLLLLIIITINVILIIRSYNLPDKTPSVFGVKMFVVVSRKHGARNKCRRCCFC